MSHYDILDIPQLTFSAMCIKSATNLKQSAEALLVMHSYRCLAFLHSHIIVSLYALNFVLSSLCPWI